MVGGGGDLINMLCSAVLFSGGKKAYCQFKKGPDLCVSRTKVTASEKIHFGIKVEKVIKVGVLKTLLQRSFKI